ncbi:MAG: MFS transporter [Jiangellaceae bacterium]|nr:MFS transporter [Jiangellaceae bacterium]
MISPAAARRRYVVISALTWLPAGLGMPAFVLLMRERGLDVVTIGTVFAVYGAVTVLMELPTGGLADVIGRRGVLLASAALTTASFAAMALATTAVQFLVLSVTKGLARSLSSGPAEAWYVDTVHAGDPEGDLRAGLSRGSAAGSAALALGTLTGGGLPLLVPSSWPVAALAAPMVCAAVAGATLFAVVAVWMTEPRRPGRRQRPVAVLRAVPATVLSGARLGLRSRSLTRLLAVSLALGVALNAIELLTPGRLATLTGGAETGTAGYAAVAAGGFLASAVGAALAAPLARLFRGVTWRATVAAGLLAAGSLGGLAATAELSGMVGLVTTGAGYVLLFLGFGLAHPLRAELLHARVGAAERATLLSIDSMLLQLGGVASALGLSVLARQFGLDVAWSAAAVALLAATVALVRTPSHEPHPDIVATTPAAVRKSTMVNSSPVP